MALEHINFRPSMTKFLVNQQQAFAERPLLILDVGARGGFEDHWQIYGEQAIQIGFEPDVEECNRLNQQSRHKNCNFYPVALGNQQEERTFTVCHWRGSSSFYPANFSFIGRFPYKENLAAMEVIKQIKIETVDLDFFVQSNSINYVDFIKLDVEGSELDVLKGALNILQTSVLGLSLEVLFHSCIRNQPTFSHIDLFLDSLGFRLFDLAIYRQARKALPLPTIPPLGVTQQGQVLWGQALYLRDGFSELESNQELYHWDQVNVLKLASLMELFCLPDCAVELIQKAQQKHILTETIEPLLNSLTPPMKKGNTFESISYEQYLQLFQ